MPAIPYHEKLLSHRVRGFAEYENTRTAFSRACQSSARYLEIDTRVSADGVIFVYHDPVASKIVEPALRFSDVPSAAVKSARFLNGEPLMLLSEALEIFATRSDKQQSLCIDIKDFGFEESHFRLVRERGLENNTTFVSWIPQSLLKLSELGARTPLILSQWNLHRFGPAGRLLGSILSMTLWPFSHFVLVGRDRFDSPLRHLSHGYQHGYVSCRLPDKLAGILARSGGGICVPLSVLSDSLVRYCDHAGIALWLFSVGDREHFEKYAAIDGVKVVFCDDAPAVLGTEPTRSSVLENR